MPSGAGGAGNSKYVDRRHSGCRSHDTCGPERYEVHVHEGSVGYNNIVRIFKEQTPRKGVFLFDFMQFYATIV